MNKTREQLEKEYAKNAAKLEQYRHKGQQGDRKERAHRLITRGAAVESIVPEIQNVHQFLLTTTIYCLCALR